MDFDGIIISTKSFFFKKNQPVLNIYLEVVKEICVS